MQLSIYMALVSNWSEFYTAVKAMAGRLKIPADWLLDVMYIESKLKATAKNPNSTATGLIQFMEATARGLGTTTAKLRQMNNIQQLPYVERYFRNMIASKGQPKDFFDTYCLVFYPAFVGKPDSYLAPASITKPNIALDGNKDGRISKGEFRAWAHRQVKRPLELATKGLLSVILLVVGGWFMHSQGMIKL